MISSKIYQNIMEKIWEYVSEWSCEDFLKQCIIRNQLSKEYLVSEDQYRILLNVIKR